MQQLLLMLRMLKKEKVYPDCASKMNSRTSLTDFKRRKTMHYLAVKKISALLN